MVAAEVPGNVTAMSKYEAKHRKARYNTLDMEMRCTRLSL